MDECKQSLNEDEMGQVNGGSMTLCDEYQCPRCGGQIVKRTYRPAMTMGVVASYYCLACQASIPRKDLVKV